MLFLFNGLNWFGVNPSKNLDDYDFKKADNFSIISSNEITSNTKTFINQDDTLEFIKKIIYYFTKLGNISGNIQVFGYNDLFMWENFNNNNIVPIGLNFPQKSNKQSPIDLINNFLKEMFFYNEIE